MKHAGKILVIGGGIGGLATAIAARQAGVEVDLVELRSDWKVYHVGILVQGNFLRVLEAMGMVDDVVRVGYPMDSLTFEDLHGRVFTTIPGQKLASPQYPANLGITRPALHQVMTDHARQAGVNIRLGVTYTTLMPGAEHADVAFTDGTDGRYDQVIGADGVHSSVRETLFGQEHQPQFTGQAVWRYNVKRPPDVTHMSMCMGLKRGKCGFTPVNEATGYVLLVQAEPGNPRYPEEQLADRFRERLAACTGKMAALRDQITDPALVVYRPLEALLMPAPWYRGNALLIGDAVHATTPHLGQGAAQAVEDGWVVGQLLAEGLCGEALGAAFMARRYERLKLIWQNSLQIGQWELDEDPSADPAGLTRQTLAALAAAV